MKKALIITLGVLVLLAIGAKVAVYLIQGGEIEQGETELRFEPLNFPFTHETDLDSVLPFMALTPLDVDGDGVDEVFIGGGRGQADALFKYSAAGFKRTSDLFEFSEEDPEDATYGAANLDVNRDGLDDLFVARASGVYLYESQIDASFSKRKIEFGIAENTEPLSIALSDINKDGWVDLYISGYIKSEHVEGETIFNQEYGGYSYLLLNTGDNQWADISQEAGVFRQHNTFVAMFIDLDNDSWSDLVVAEDTGVVETWKNNRDETFSRMPNPTVNSYPMGIGAGDINNDGLVDLYFSNVGTTLPKAMVRGDLTDDQPFNTDYMLLRNEGDFVFKDIASEVNAGRYGFGWGTLISDFNLDGLEDLYFAQNYARFPGVKFLELYPGRLLQQFPDGKFQAVEGVAGINNKHFGITQVVSDFNQDGWPDMVQANLVGPAQAFINQGGTNHGIAVKVPNQANYLNARVEVTTGSGQVLTRQVMAGEGLGSDQSRTLWIGLGEEGIVDHVKVMLINGQEKVYGDVEVDRTLSVDLGLEEIVDESE